MLVAGGAKGEIKLWDWQQKMHVADFVGHSVDKHVNYVVRHRENHIISAG